MRGHFACIVTRVARRRVPAEFQHEAQRFDTFGARHGARTPLSANISAPNAQNSAMKSVTAALPGAARITYPNMRSVAPIFRAASRTSCHVRGRRERVLPERVAAIEIQLRISDVRQGVTGAGAVRFAAVFLCGAGTFCCRAV